MSEATFSVRYDDAETSRLLEKSGSSVRDNVTAALAGLTRQLVSEARAAAPTARTAAGVQAYGVEQDNAWNEKASGSGMPRAMLDSIARTMQMASQGQLVTLIANTYYLGRFREEGFSGTVDVRAHTRRAPGRKGWGRSGSVAKMYASFRKSGITSKGEMAKKARGYGWTDRNVRLLVSGGQVAVDFKKGRRHRVAKRPFMPNVADVDARLRSAVDRAIKEGLSLARS